MVAKEAFENLPHEVRRFVSSCEWMGWFALRALRETCFWFS